MFGEVIINPQELEKRGITLEQAMKEAIGISLRATPPTKHYVEPYATRFNKETGNYEAKWDTEMDYKFSMRRRGQKSTKWLKDQEEEGWTIKIKPI